MRWLRLQILMCGAGSMAMGLLAWPLINRIWPDGRLLLLTGVVAGTFCLIERVSDSFLRDVRERDSNQQLRKCGLPLCTCGYSLAGLTEPRCPECGQTFDPNAAWFRRTVRPDGADVSSASLPQRDTSAPPAPSPKAPGDAS